jgi:thymidine phosphorylase
MSTLRNNEDPVLEEVLATIDGEELNPEILDLAMKLAEKMFLKMKQEDLKRKAKEEEIKKRAEEEESRRKVEEEKGKKKLEYNDDLVELLVSKVMNKVGSNDEESSIKKQG